MADNIFGIELVVKEGERYVPLSESDVYHVLETILNLEPEEDVCTIQMHSPNPRRVDIRTKCLAVWSDRDIYSFIDKQYVLDNGKIVQIIRPYEDYTFVRVKRVPLSWNNETVKRILSNYGIVKSVREESFHSERDGYERCTNGNYGLRMKITKPIPSTLSIRYTKIEIWHSGQDQTCWKCGMAHSKSECHTTFKNFINRFTWADFPELPPPEMGSAPSQEVVVSAPSQEVVVSAPSQVVSAPSQVVSAAPSLVSSAPSQVVSAPSQVVSAASSLVSSAPSLVVSAPSLVVSAPSQVILASNSDSVSINSPAVNQPSTYASVTAASTPITSVTTSTNVSTIQASMEIDSVPASSMVESPVTLVKPVIIKSQMSSKSASVSSSISSTSAIATSSAVASASASSAVASVSTVYSNKKVIMSTSTETNQVNSDGDSTDGAGTVDRAYNLYVAAAPEIEVHHAENSQVLGNIIASSVINPDWEATLTASDMEEEDHLITPAQRTSDEMNLQSQDPTDEDMNAISMETNENERNEDKKRKERFGSSDDDNSVNDIVMNFGSFVNSFNPFGGSRDKNETKRKNEPKKVKVDVETV